jgi:hypothetical protein
MLEKEDYKLKKRISETRKKADELLSIKERNEMN